MGPEPGKVVPHDGKQIALKKRLEISGLRVGENKMKNEAGDKQNSQYQKKIINQADDTAPESGSGIGHVNCCK